MHYLNKYMSVSVWDCYASSDSDIDSPSFDPLPDYKNVTHSFENVCAHGIIVCAWVILSTIGFIAINLIKVDLGELVIKGLMIGELVCLVLSAGWLLNATYQRYGNAGKVCSGDFLDSDWVEDWGYPGPYIS